MTVPPRPPHSPFQTAADNMNTLADHQRQGRGWGNGTPPGQRQGGPKPDMSKGGNTAAQTNAFLGSLPSDPANAPTGGRGHDHGPSGNSSVPGADFMSDEDIRAFCEYIRKDSRNRATERAMDADHLEAVLRTIPDVHGSRSGSRARARRVSRWLKKIAAAEKAQQKYAAMLYGTFTREFETELKRLSPGRPKQQNRRAPFQFGR